MSGSRFCLDFGEESDEFRRDFGKDDNEIGRDFDLMKATTYYGSEKEKNGGFLRQVDFVGGKL